MRILDRTTQAILVFLVAALVAIVFGQIVMRYATTDVPPWTEEVARYLFAWIVFIGTAVAYRQKTHVVIDILVSRMPPAVQRGAQLAILIATALFLSVILYHGILNLLDEINDFSPVMQISMAIIHLPLSVGMTLLFICVAADIVGYLRQPEV